MLSSRSLNPRLPALARICGNTLLLAFVAVVLFSVFPLQIGSPLWGSQLSSRIVDGASLALVGTTLLSAAAYLQSMPEDPDMARGKVILLNKQRLFALRLSGIGVISLAWPSAAPAPAHTAAPPATEAARHGRTAAHPTPGAKAHGGASARPLRPDQGQAR